MTAARRPEPGQVMTMPARALRALRHVNDELTRASEAIIRSARAPQPRLRVQPPATGGGPQRDTVTERAVKAA
jgi:hypothetical protein